MIDFAEFWEIYPRKTAKKPARAVWEKLAPNQHLLEAIRTNIEARIMSGEWREKRFIPYPATYLNQERWEDEIISDAKTLGLPVKTRDTDFVEQLFDRTWAD